jgi:hypothetical protein
VNVLAVVLAQTAEGPAGALEFLSYGVTGVVLILVITGKWLRTEREVKERDVTIAEMKEIIQLQTAKMNDEVVPLLATTSAVLSKALEMIHSAEGDPRG